MFLAELRTSVTELKGVGPSIAKAYASLGIYSYKDLLAHIPRTYEDRQHPVTLAQLHREPCSAYVIVEVIAHEYIGHGSKRTLKVIVSDETAVASLLCFGRNFLERMLTVGRHFHLYGTFSRHFGELQCSTFEVEPRHQAAEPKQFGLLLPVYGLASGLTQKTLRRDITHVMEQSCPYLEEELPEELISRHRLLSYPTALQQIHFPSDFAQMHLALKTLSYTELFYLQTAMLRRAAVRREQKRSAHLSRAVNDHTSFSEPDTLAGRLVSSLPFSLTADQETVLAEIEQDLSQPYPMNRLLQGDVGSGKTLTGFISILPIIESGGQAAFMAPTELLAKQHAESAARFLEPLGVRIALLTGSVSARQRKLLIAALASGELDLVIGTHALFSDDVRFRDLRYVIIDEQQRFGVAQRISLMQKGISPHQLLMTATPIPRTMALTVFGGLDISTIRTMPPGRMPVITHLASEKSRDRVYHAVRVEFERGHQAYFVYPRIEASTDSELRDAQSMYEYLRTQQYPDRKGGLIHSRISEDEKISIMHQFRDGALDYLVSTSVVEVGVDVANATCMIIEHAERFGLSALHQLRGRVGRDAHQSYAFLIYSNELQEDGKKRLKVMKESHDGFVIAEQDLLIRGPGELSGKRQSGYLALMFADIIRDLALMKSAREDARMILDTDQSLLKAEYAPIRALLTRCPPFDDGFIE